MKITVVGAGNMGLAIVSYLASKEEYSVNLFTKKKFNSLIMNDVEENKKKETSRFSVTDDASAFSEADYILCTYPSFLRRKLIEDYGTYIKSGAKLGFIPGYGGAEYACKNLLQRGVIIFGLQRVPYVARAVGNEAMILSKKNKLYVASVPSKYTNEISSDIEKIFDIATAGLKEYLSITLAPSNPLLHITGLYAAFKNYDPDIGYTGKSGFYEQWDDETSKLLFKYDEELQNICSALYPLDMKDVVPLPIYYESDTPEKMTQKLRSIQSFKVVQVPLKGNAPDLNSRMFIEDYPYGVCVIKDVAQMVGIETPTIDMLLKFYNLLSGHKYFNDDGTYTEEIKTTGVPGIYGINNKEDLISFYHGR